MGLIGRIRRSVSRLPDCKRRRHWFLNRIIQDVSAFYLPEWLIAIYLHHDANRHLCISKCQPFVSLNVADFVLLYKLSSSLAGCSVRLRQYDQLTNCHPIGVLKSVGAFVQAFSCLWLHGCDVPRRRYSHFASPAISIDSTKHSQHHPREPLFLVSRGSFS